MRPFETFTGVVAPIDRTNVDTDAIIPKQFLKSIKRSGFGGNLFDGWRYLDHGEPDKDSTGRPENPEFVLNHKRFRNAEILLTRENFGCGSSREHAVWALRDYGFRAIIASSFADIFFNNCFKNGVLPVVLTAANIDDLFRELGDRIGHTATVDLEQQTVSFSNLKTYNFEIEPGRKYRLLGGLDDIDLTLQHKDEIRRFEDQARLTYPWLFNDLV